MSFHIFFCNIIKVDQFLHYFIIFLHLSFSFLHIKCLLLPYAYFSTESIHFILLSSLLLNAIFLTYSVKIFYLLLLNLCCVFNINLFVFCEFIFSKNCCFILIFFYVVYFIFKLNCF